MYKHLLGTYSLTWFRLKICWIHKKGSDHFTEDLPDRPPLLLPILSPKSLSSAFPVLLVSWFLNRSRLLFTTFIPKKKNGVFGNNSTRSHQWYQNIEDWLSQSRKIFQVIDLCNQAPSLCLWASSLERPTRLKTRDSWPTILGPVGKQLAEYADQASDHETAWQKTNPETQQVRCKPLQTTETPLYIRNKEKHRKTY